MNKVFEKGSKLFLTGCVTFSVFTGNLSFLHAKEVEVNVALNAEVSTEGEDTDYGGLATKLNDGDDNTAWALGSATWPTNITLKLDKATLANKVVVKLGSADWAEKASVDVEVFYAINGVTSDLGTFSAKKEAQPLGSEVVFTAEDIKSISHVYVKLSNPKAINGYTGDLTLWPSIREIEVYETQEEKISNYNNIAAQAEISTDGDNQNDSNLLVDNNPSTLYKFYTKQLYEEKHVDLSFGEARTMDAFEIDFENVGESDQYEYKFVYSILGKNGDSDFVTLVDHQKANRSDNSNQIYQIEAAKYSDIRIIMHETTSNYGDGIGWPAIAEFAVYGSEAEYQDTESIAFKKPVHTNSNRSTASSIVDGSTKTTWNGSMYPGYADIDLEENYDLNAIEVFTPAKGYSQYEIYTSLDGRDFTKLAEKSNTEACPETGDVYDATGTEARYIRIYVTYNSASSSSSISEVRVLGEKSGSPLQETPAVNVADYSDTAYASALANITNQDTFNEVNGIITRRLGSNYVDWFSLEIAENPKGHDYDYFELSNVDGTIHIKGNNGVSLAMGLNHYLKYFCNVNISQVGDQVTMPADIVSIDGKVFKETKAKVRYAYNYCTLSYSMPFYGEEEWRNELDWLALNGVNVVLDATGQEEVWRRFLTKIGYEHEDIKDFIAGPAYYAWAYMANLSGFGGPVHDSWFEQRTELARQNQLSMSRLGMQPVLQGYSGMVPNDLADHDSDAAANIIAQGTWCSFQRPDMLKTDTETYERYAKLFYESQKEVYGDVTQYYATDPFHEGGNTGGMSSTTVASKVLDSLLNFDDDAVWIIQSWQGNPSNALLNGLDGREEHALILDLYADKTPNYDKYGETKEFDGTPWLFCMLNNFGGRLGLHGHLDNLANNIPEVFNNTEYVAGIGITPEASVNNPLLYDFLFETVWTDDATQTLEVIDLESWLNDYATRRYGAVSESAQEALNILKDTVYKAEYNQNGQGAPESVVNSRPSFSINAASTWGNSVIDYDKGKLEDAAALLLKDYDKLKDSEGYRYDLATVLEQVLSNSAQEYLKKMKSAYDSGSAESFKEASDDFLSIIDKMEEVTSTSKYYLLGTWVNQAKALAEGTDDFTKELYEWNAKTLITTWGSISQSESGGLHDYSNRQWSGLINDFYKARWQIWIDNRATELATGTKVSDPNWFTWEWDWARGDDAYTSTPSNLDLSVLGNEILSNFSVKNPATDDSNDIDISKISVEAGDYEKTQGEQYGDGKPEYVLDGNRNTKWHTSYNGSERANHYLTFTLDQEQKVSGLRYLPRTDGGNGTITAYEVYIKNSESEDWQKVITNGKLDFLDRDWQILTFDDGKEFMASQVKFVVLDATSYSDSIKLASLTEMRLLKGTEDIISDVTELNKAIKAAEALVKAEYTEASWKAVETALSEAKALSTEDAQATIDEATEKLNAAVKALVKLSDVTELNKAIKAAEALVKTEYTEASWKAVETALSEAKALSTEDAQATIDEATEKLNAAVKALVKLSDVTELNKAIKAAEALVKAEYTEASWKAVETALSEAKALSTEDAQATIDEVTEKLNAAVKALVKVSDVTELNKAIKTAEALVKAEYTEASWKAVETALSEAKDLDKEASQESVDEAVLKLQNAINGLIKVDAGKEEPDTPDTSDKIQNITISNNSDTISISGMLDSSAQLITKEFNQEEIQNLLSIIKDDNIKNNFKIEKAFDMKLIKNGMEIQPDGTIIVRINVDKKLLEKDIQAVYIDDEGNVTRLETRKGTDYVEFDTTHNSTYAIISKLANSQGGADTGDHTNAGMSFFLLLISGGAIVILSKKRKA